MGEQQTGVLGGEAFVGRAEELGSLRAAVDRLRAGRGSLAVIGGEPGIGKTRLAEEVATYGSASGASTLWATCWEGGGAPALWPWSQLLRTWARHRDVGPILETMGPERAELGRLVPSLAPALGEPPAIADPEQARFRLFDSVTTFLHRAAAEQPLVAVLDDLQWADPSSLLLLDFLARELHGCGLLLVGTYRDVEVDAVHPLHRTLASLPRDALRLEVSGLDDRAVAQLVAALAGREVRDELARAVCERTGGNPFFVREIVRLLAAQGRLDAAEQDPARADVLPGGIREVAERRLARLPDRCTRLLEVAAVIGHECDTGLLEAVAGLPRVDLLDLLDEAVGARVVAELSGRAPRYAFTHALLRDALYDRLPRKRRCELHRTVADSLADLHADRLADHAAEIARHLAQAGSLAEPAAAVQYSELAGDAALGMLAYEEAATHFGRALDALAQAGDDLERRCHLLLARADALERSGDTTPARESYQAAAALARQRGDGVALARAAVGFGRRVQYVGFAGTDLALVELLEDALDLLPPDDDPLRAETLSRLVQELHYTQPERARRVAEEIAAMAARLGDPRTRLHALWQQYLFLFGSAQAAQRLELIEEAVRLGQELGDPAAELEARIYRVVSLLELGELDGTDREIQTFTHLAERARLPAYRWHPALWRAMRALLQGHVDDAERLAVEALELGETHGQNALDHFGIQLLAIRREQGRLGELHDAVAENVKAYPQIPAYRCALAFILAETGRLAAARAELDRLAANDFAEVPRDYSWAISAAMLAETGALLGDAEAAGRLYELLLPYGGTCVFVGQAAVCLGSIDRYLALCALTAGWSSEAAAHFEAALKTNTRLGATGIVARTRLEYGRMLRDGPATGRDRAAELLAQADGAAHELGLTDLAEKLAATRDRPPPGDSGDSGATGAAEEAHVFRREGEMWTLTYDGTTARMKHSKGLLDIRALVAAPGREIHVGELIAAADGADAGRPTDRRQAADEGLAPAARDAGPALDARAQAEYRARLVELTEEIDEADAYNDTARASRLREERDFIAAELASALGLAGRPRRMGDDTERARKAVLQRVANTLTRVARAHPALAEHLRRSIRTGTFCSYVPERPTSWRV